MPDCSCEELISLSELAELVFGNAQRTDLGRAALSSEPGQARNEVSRRAARPLRRGSRHPRLPRRRSPRAARQRLALRTPPTTAPQHACAQGASARTSREARLRLHLERVEREVDEELARSAGASWQSARSRR
jgi:hypothetical protein